MTPPIDNLNYLEGDGFRRRARRDPALGALVKQFLEQWPNKGTVICGGLRTVEVSGYTVVVLRDFKRHKIAPLVAFQLPGEQKLLDDYLAQARVTYCGGSHA